MSVEAKSESTVKRRLIAIAFADIVGFSALCERDDAGTLARFEQLLDLTIRPLIEAHEGKLRRINGDELFVTFESAVAAVRWGKEMQDAVAMANRASSGPVLRFRIGINVEDAILGKDDLHGDGVNIAKRIQELAAPGDVLLSGAVREYVWNKLAFGLINLGDQRLKNISGEVRVFRIDPDPRSNSPLNRTDAEPAGNKRPFIAVLPFRNPTDSQSDDFFGEGMTENIITALSRTRAMYVIARSSTLAFRNSATNIKEIASLLGVRYLVDGSIQRMGERLRIHARLLDAQTNLELWSRRYDGMQSDIFEFQDQISSSVVATIVPAVRMAESNRVRTKNPDNLEAYECVLRALPLFHKFENQEFDQARHFLERAIALEHDYAHAHAYMAWLLLLLVAEARAKDIEATSKTARNHIEYALKIEPQDPLVLAVAGHVHSLLVRQPDVAALYFDRSLAIDENSAFAWGMSGLTYCYLGEPDEAMRRFNMVTQLSPLDPLMFFYTAGKCLAEFLSGRYEAALPWAQKAFRENARFLAGLRHYLACLGQLGRIEEAQPYVAALLALEPGFRVSAFESWYPLRPAGNLSRYVEGLRRVGLPE